MRLLVLACACACAIHTCSPVAASPTATPTVSPLAAAPLCDVPAAAFNQEMVRCLGPQTGVLRRQPSFTFAEACSYAYGPSVFTWSVAVACAKQRVQSEPEGCAELCVYACETGQLAGIFALVSIKAYDHYMYYSPSEGALPVGGLDLQNDLFNNLTQLLVPDPTQSCRPFASCKQLCSAQSTIEFTDSPTMLPRGQSPSADPSPAPSTSPAGPFAPSASPSDLPSASPSSPAPSQAPALRPTWRPVSPFPTVPNPDSGAYCDETAAAIFASASADELCARTSAGVLVCLAHGVDSLVANTLTGLLDVVDLAFTQGPYQKVQGFAPNAACFIRANGTIGCIGSNDLGVLGQLPPYYADTVALPLDTNVSGTVLLPVKSSPMSIHAVLDAFCALMDDGQAVCWGHSLYTGDFTNFFNRSTLPHRISLGSGVEITQLASTSVTFCALTTTARVKCWGDCANVLCDGNHQGGLLLTPEDGDNVPFIDLGTNVAVKSLHGGVEHICALLSAPAGKAKCWGIGGAALGTRQGSTPYNSAPIFGSPQLFGDHLPFVALDSMIKSMALGNGFTCALLAEGTVQCFGVNNLNQLGDNSGTTRGGGGYYSSSSQGMTNLATLRFDHQVVSMVAAGATVAVLLSNGQVLAWGLTLSAEYEPGYLMVPRSISQLLCLDDPTPAPTDVPTSSPVPLLCLANEQFLQGNCYALLAQPLNYSQASLQCQSLGGVLTPGRDAADRAALALLGCTLTLNCSVGLRAGPDWEWSDGAPFHADFWQQVDGGLDQPSANLNQFYMYTGAAPDVSPGLCAVLAVGYPGLVLTHDCNEPVAGVCKRAANVPCAKVSLTAGGNAYCTPGVTVSLSVTTWTELVAALALSPVEAIVLLNDIAVPECELPLSVPALANISLLGMGHTILLQSSLKIELDVRSDSVVLLDADLPSASAVASGARAWAFTSAYLIQGVGDVNGDGRADVSVSGLNRGTALVGQVLGSIAAFGLVNVSFSPLQVPSTNYFVSSSQFVGPVSVGGAGDIDGDSFDDLFAAHFLVNVSIQESYVMESTLQLLLGGPALDKASSVHSTLGDAADGVAVLHAYPVGDFNSDGYDDFVWLVLPPSPLVTAYSTFLHTTVLAYLVLGGPTWLAAGYDVYWSQQLRGRKLPLALGAGVLPLVQSLNANAVTSSLLQNRLSRAGDVNVDGYADFIAQGDDGMAFLVFGSPVLLTNGVNAVGEAAFDPTLADTTSAVVFLTASGGALPTVGSPCLGGLDFNGDGLADMLFTTVEMSAHGKPNFYLVLVLGSPSWPTPVVDLSSPGLRAVRRFSASFQQAPTPSPTAGVAAFVNTPGPCQHLEAVGDLDLDGFDDFAALCGSNAVLVFGSASLADFDITEPSGDVIHLVAPEPPLFIKGLGDVDGDGWPDVSLTSAEFSFIIWHPGSVRALHGSRPLFGIGQQANLTVAGLSVNGSDVLAVSDTAGSLSIASSTFASGFSGAPCPRGFVYSDQAQTQAQGTCTPCAAGSFCPGLNCAVASPYTSPTLLTLQSAIVPGVYVNLLDGSSTGRTVTPTFNTAIVAALGDVIFAVYVEATFSAHLAVRVGKRTCASHAWQGDPLVLPMSAFMEQPWNFDYKGSLAAVAVLNSTSVIVAYQLRGQNPAFGSSSGVGFEIADTASGQTQFIPLVPDPAGRPDFSKSRCSFAAGTRLVFTCVNLYSSEGNQTYHYVTSYFSVDSGQHWTLLDIAPAYARLAPYYDSGSAYPTREFPFGLASAQDDDGNVLLLVGVSGQPCNALLLRQGSVTYDLVGSLPVSNMFPDGASLTFFNGTFLAAILDYEFHGADPLLVAAFSSDLGATWKVAAVAPLAQLSGSSLYYRVEREYTTDFTNGLAPLHYGLKASWVAGSWCITFSAATTDVGGSYPWQVWVFNATWSTWSLNEDAAPLSSPQHFSVAVGDPPDALLLATGQGTVTTFVVQRPWLPWTATGAQGSWAPVATGMTACPPGYFCPAGSHQPRPCPAGFVHAQTQQGLTSSAECSSWSQPCASGFWCGAGAVKGSSYVQQLSFSASEVNALLIYPASHTYDLTVANVGTKDIRLVAAQPLPTWLSVSSTGLNLSLSVGLRIAAGAVRTLSLVFDSDSLGAQSPAVNGTLALSWWVEAGGRVPQGDSVLAPASGTEMSASIALGVTVLPILVYPQSLQFSVDIDGAVPTSATVSLFNALPDHAIAYSLRPGCASQPFVDPSGLVSVDLLQGSVLPQVGPALFTFQAQAVSSPAILALINGASRAGQPLGATRPVPLCYTLDMSIDDVASSNVTQQVTITVTVLQKCPPGQYSSRTDNLGGCALCPVSSFQAQPGQTACVACTNSTITAAPGANSSSLCVSPPGFVTVNGAVVDCSSIPGAICNESGVTLTTLPLMPGFWRRLNSTEVFVCPIPELCVGSFGDHSSRRRALQSSNDSKYDLCRVYSTGVFCELCVEGTVRRGELGLCGPCSDSTLAADVGHVATLCTVTVFLLIFASLVIGIHARRSAQRNHRHAPDDDQEGDSDDKACSVRAWLSLSVKARIIVGMLQIIASSAVTLSQWLPPQFLSFARAMSFLSIGFLQLADTGCAIARSHYSELLASTLIPIVVIVMWAGLYCVMDRSLAARQRSAAEAEIEVDARASVRSWFSFGALLVLFLVFPGTCTRIFGTFACKSDQANTFSVLVIDPSLSCWAPEYPSYRAYAATMVLVYPVGVPLLFWALLFRHQTHLHSLGALVAMGAVGPPGEYRRPEFNLMAQRVRKMDPTVRHISFLFAPYTAEYFYFEVVDLLRKLLQTSVVVFIADASSQLISQVAIALAALLLVVQLRPYSDPINNRLALFAQLILLCEALVALLVCLASASLATYNEHDLDNFMVALLGLVFALVAWDLLNQTAAMSALTRGSAITRRAAFSLMVAFTSTESSTSIRTTTTAASMAAHVQAASDGVKSAREALGEAENGLEEALVAWARRKHDENKNKRAGFVMSDGPLAAYMVGEEA